MSIFRKLLAVSCLSVFPLSCNATVLGSKITLTGGSISPNHDIEISFGRLLEGVVYRVDCDAITSNNKSKRDIDYIKLYSYDNHLKPILNGNPLGKSWQGFILTESPNQLSLNNVTSASASIIIRNLDDTDTITVDKCYALPEA